jgi:tetratricopeptide (TPR) repeat protein
MASNKRLLNFIFACITVALAATALLSVYFKSGSSLSHSNAVPESSSNQLPENHPPIDTAKRLAALEQMSAKDPQNADLQTQMGDLYYDLGQYDKAANCYEKSLNIRPREPNVETDLATCWHYLGQDDKALEIFNKVLSYSPNFPQALYNKGIVLISGKKDVKGGVAVWEELLRTDPAYANRAALEQRINELKASVK